MAEKKAASKKAKAPQGAPAARPNPYTGMPCVFIPQKDNDFPSGRSYAAIVTGIPGNQPKGANQVNLHVFSDSIHGTQYRRAVDYGAPDSSDSSSWDYAI